MQRYQRMQRSPFTKLMTSLDGSVLRRNLWNILASPKYSIEQLAVVAAPLRPAKPIFAQENNVETVSSVDSDANNKERLAMQQKIAQMQAQLQQLVKDTGCADSFLKPPEVVNHCSRFFTAPHALNRAPRV